MQPDYARSTQVFSFFHYEDWPWVFCAEWQCKNASWAEASLFHCCDSINIIPGHAKGGSGPAGKARLQPCLRSDGVMESWGANFVRKGENYTGIHWCVAICRSPALYDAWWWDENVKMTNGQMAFSPQSIKNWRTDSRAEEGRGRTQWRFINIHHATVRHAVNMDKSLGNEPQWIYFQTSHSLLKFPLLDEC